MAKKQQKIRANNTAKTSTTPPSSEPKRAAHFRVTRQQHNNEAAEDYTELIAELIASSGEARTGKIAKHLGISHVTALRTIKRLEREGFVETDFHKPIVLTKKGAKLAELARQRHQLLVAFLISLGVPEQIAEIDAEGAEHHIGEVTLACIKRFMQKICRENS